MTTKYLLTNGKTYICSNDDHEIYTSKCPYKAFVTTDISRLTFIYDTIPHKYACDNWYVVDYSTAMDEQTRYRLTQKNRKKMKKHPQNISVLKLAKKQKNNYSKSIMVNVQFAVNLYL